MPFFKMDQVFDLIGLASSPGRRISSLPKTAVAGYESPAGGRDVSKKTLKAAMAPKTRPVST